MFLDFGYLRTVGDLSFRLLVEQLFFWKVQEMESGAKLNSGSGGPFVETSNYGIPFTPDVVETSLSGRPHFLLIWDGKRGKPAAFSSQVWGSEEGEQKCWFRTGKSMIEDPEYHRISSKISQIANRQTSCSGITHKCIELLYIIYIYIYIY